MMEFVELLSFPSEHEAKLAGSRLHAVGIPSSVSKDDAGGMEPHLQLSRSVRLLVPPDRVQDARRILRVAKK
jgi:hypothetical protein